MTLNLVHGWYDPSSLNDLFEHFDREIRYSNSLDFFSLFRDPNHLLPCSSNTRSLGVDSFRAIFVVGSELFADLESDWPVDEIDV
jgi:hypothetical protein